jgi:hypothetical protein
VKCAILPWHTLHAAPISVTATPTEAEEIRCTPQSAMPDPVGGHAQNSEIEGTPNRNAEVHPQGIVDLGCYPLMTMPSRPRTIRWRPPLFEIDHVTNIFYVDRWITITQTAGQTGRISRAT